MSPRRGPLAVLMAVLVAVAGGLPVAAQDASADATTSLAVPSDADLPADAALTPAVAPQPLPAELDLAPVRMRLEEVFAGLPAGDWTIPDLAAVMVFDPRQPFTFVRDRVAFQPYAGVLRGAEGALAARAGNSWDRALLLKALLDAMLVPTRLAWGDLEPDVAASLVERGLEMPPGGLEDALAGIVSAIARAPVAERARRDYAQLRAALGDRVQAMAGPESDQARAEVARHAWVQALIGTEWVDLDPTLTTAQVGDALTTAIGTGDAPPADERQTVTVRVTVEHLVDGVLHEDVVLDAPLDAAESQDRITTLTFKPRSEQLGATIDTLFSGVADWVPVLGSGDQPDVQGSSFMAGGSGTDVFGTDVDAPPLTAIRLEFISAGPARDPVTAESPILDRVPPALREAAEAGGAPAITEDQLLPLAGDVTGAAAVARVNHLLISTGGFNAREHIGDLGAGLDYVNDVLLDPEAAKSQTLDDLLRPMMATDDQLVAGAELLSLPALRDSGRVGAFVAAPRVYLAVFGPADQADRQMFRFDLALDDVRILADPSVSAEDVALRRIWYGALQSAVETELGLARARSADPAAVTLLGATFDSGGDLGILDAAAIAGRAHLPAALVAGVEAGGVAVVPVAGPVPDTWWAVAADGQTRSLSAPGHGNISFTGFPPSNYNGVRQLPRVPPSSSGGSGAGTTWGNQGGKTVPLGQSCNPAGGSTGYGTVLSCASVPGGIAFRLVLAVAIDAVIFAVIWGAFAAVEAAYGPGG